MGVQQAFLRFDRAVATTIGRLPKQMDGPFQLIGIVIQPLFWVAMCLVVAFLASSHSQAITAAALYTAAGVFISSLLKVLFRRHRPVTIYTKAMKIKSYSFPSSHAYAAALGATFLSIVSLLVAPMVAPLVIGWLAIVVVIVSVSRVFVGAHYPSDVCGGIILGVLVAISISGAVGLY